MAKELASDTIMPAGKLKPLLALSKREPVQAAVAITTDGDGLILLDKKAKPRKVASLLRANAAKAKLQLNNATIRFGRAEVDPEYDAATVRFTLNKEAPGTLRVKLVEVVRRAAFQKVELLVDEALEQEAEEDAPAQEGAPAQAAAAPSPAAGNLDGLRTELAGLVGRIAETAGDDAGKRKVLTTIAGAASAAIKAEAAEQAAAAIEKLKQALSLVAGKPAGGATGALLARVRAAREGWMTATETVDRQIGALAKALQGDDDPDLQKIASTGLTTVTGGFRTRMMAALADLGQDDIAMIRKSGPKAAGFADKLRATIESDARVIACDTNEFGVAMSIGATLGPALSELAGALRAAAKG